MKKANMKQFEKSGWRVGSAAVSLKFSPEESGLVEWNSLILRTVTNHELQMPVDPLALNEALTGLENVSGRACQMVELRFFAGLTEAKAVNVLDISLTTFKRDWTLAKNWLYGQLR